MRFAQTGYLYLLWLLPMLGALVIYSFRKKRKALEAFGNYELMKKLSSSRSAKKEIAKALLLVAGLMFLILALAHPQLGARQVPVKHKGIDVVIAVDVSESMNAQDIKPSRLKLAKRELSLLIDQLAGNRIGVVLFAGTSFIQCPITLDTGAAKIFLDIIDTDSVPTPGTNIGEAIRTSISAFNSKEKKHKVLILLTDGEDHGGEALSYAKQAKDEGIKIYTVGIGTTKGEPIPVMGEKGSARGYKKDKRGEVVLSRIDERLLTEIADATDGRYLPPSGNELSFEDIFYDISRMEKKELEGKLSLQYEDRFQFPLFLAFLCLIAEFLLGTRRKVRE